MILLDPAGVAVRFRRNTERWMVLDRLIVEVNLSVGNRDREGRRAEGFCRGLQIVSLSLIAPAHHDAAVTEDHPGAACGERVIAGGVELLRIHTDLGRFCGSPLVARPDDFISSESRQRHREQQNAERKSHRVGSCLWMP